MQSWRVAGILVCNCRLKATYSISMRLGADSTGAAPGTELLVHWWLGENGMPTRIVLADDHALVRQGIKSLLEREGLQIVGEASDGREAVQHAEALSPDIVVMDIGMPTLNGMEEAPELPRGCPKVQPIFLPQPNQTKSPPAASKAAHTRSNLTLPASTLL